jgi:hypothetical protein
VIRRQSDVSEEHTVSIWLPECKRSKKWAETGRKPELELSPLVLLVSSFGLLFNSEDGGDMSLQNVDLSPNYTALQLRSMYYSIDARFLNDFLKKYSFNCISVLSELPDQLPIVHFPWNVSVFNLQDTDSDIGSAAISVIVITQEIYSRLLSAGMRPHYRRFGEPASSIFHL